VLCVFEKVLVPQDSLPAWSTAAYSVVSCSLAIAVFDKCALRAAGEVPCCAGMCCAVLLQAFVAPLPVRALPGVGFKSDGLLKSWGVSTTADARSISKQQLIKGLGDKPGGPGAKFQGVLWGALWRAILTAVLALLAAAVFLLLWQLVGTYVPFLVIVTSGSAGKLCKITSQGFAEPYSWFVVHLAGASLFLACRGVDPSPVVVSGPPKSITVEDSFKACSTWQGVAQVLQVSFMYAPG
jgi:hypothetical protein